MIKTIIDKEIQRFANYGFACELQTVSVPVNTTLKQLYLGNDVYILTGLRLSADDAVGDTNTVVISSPNEQLTLTQQHISTLGTSIVKVFRNRINIVSFAKNKDFIVFDNGQKEREIITNLMTRVRSGVNVLIGYQKGDDDPIYVEGLTSEELEAIRAENMGIRFTPIYAFKKLELSELDNFNTFDINGETVEVDAFKVIQSYMTYSTGKLVEQSILPYELEFVKITPIKK